MKQLLIYIMIFLAFYQSCHAQRNEILTTDIKTLQVIVNNDWKSPPIANLSSEDYIDISFDELTHEYNRYIYKIIHCNADWSPSDLTEIDYLQGFNNNVIEDYQTSFNTTMLYTNYTFRIPNNEVSITKSGNYIVTVHNDSDTNIPVLKACFSVLEKGISVSASVSSNTDIDTNATHQQISFTINHSGYPISNPQSEIKTQVFQNRRWDNMVSNITPTYVSNGQLQYNHNQKLIFNAGNEYRRFEIIDMHYGNQGIDKIKFFDPYYHADLLTDEQRKNYSFDEDQNGRFLIRNRDASDSNIEADYMFCHFTLAIDEPLPQGEIYLQGDFTYDRFTEANRLEYDSSENVYRATLLLKQGAYNYQYLFIPTGKNEDSRTAIEGNFYETENEYMIFVYHRPFGERYDKLIGMQVVTFEQ